MSIYNLLNIIAGIVLVISIFIFLKYYKIKIKYAAVIDVDSRLAQLKAEIEKETLQRALTTAEDLANRDKLAAQYKEALGTYGRLKKEIELLEENLEDMSFGVYKPHYNFDTSAKYKEELERIWEKKKEMVRSERAAVCAIQWQVGGSRQEGKRMTRKGIKLSLRAFNGETDAAVARTAWNNVTRMEERIRKAYEAINELGSVNQIEITSEYLDLALAELRLSYEYERKRHDEQEEQREIREQMREEERAQREFERAQQEAATDEERYRKALERARADVEKAKGEESAQANERMRDLEQKLAEAQAKLQRAKSMAEQTRCGYIYVISNLGSLGEEVYKIGMTRRLEPMDRVRELGDASVPFQFDVHAMIYSEDAPALERLLHQNFEGKRVNLVNPRKEFFRLALEEIERCAREQKVKVEFTKIAEAREYRETIAILAKNAARAEKPKEDSPLFPSSVFTEPVQALHVQEVSSSKTHEMPNTASLS